MKNMFRLLVACIIGYAAKDHIKEKFDKLKKDLKDIPHESRLVPLSFKCVPNSDAERVFLERFGANGDKFMGMRVQLAQIFGRDYNLYEFEMKPDDFDLIEGLCVEIVGKEIAYAIQHHHY